MADGRKQSLLEEAWANSLQGKLSALAEAKAWALREVYPIRSKKIWGLAPLDLKILGGWYPFRSLQT